MVIEDIKKTISHPLNQKRKLKSLFNYFILGLYMRLNKEAMFIHNYIHETKLLVGKKSTSSQLQYFNSLNDFSEMSFLLHFLNHNDTFVDVGANVGVYTILAAGVSNAKVIAIEPSKETLSILKENIKINSLSNKVEVIEKAIGDKPGNVLFTQNLEAVNRIIRKEDSSVSSFEVVKTTLDILLEQKNANLIKIDVEGYEVNVLKGSKAVLLNPELKAIIIETNGLANKYELNEASIFSLLDDVGFIPFKYLPLDGRKLIKLNIDKDIIDHNTIFIRDLEFVKAKLKKAKLIKVNGINY